MKTLLLVIGVFGCFAPQTVGKSTGPGLPKGAVVVETRRLFSRGHGNRELVLWMLNPKRNPNNYEPGETYTCPDYSRGSYYSGSTQVSLLDPATNRIINTIKISKDYEEGADSFDLPYAIRRGYHYRVAATTMNGVEARPTIMWLRDYNGDGKAFEFALFDAVACMGLQTSLIGYSQKHDRVIQYPIKLDMMEGSKRSTRMSAWADYLFNQKPRRPGYWKYEIDYRGRAGPLNKWEVRYKPTLEQFEGTLTIVPGD